MKALTNRPVPAFALVAAALLLVGPLASANDGAGPILLAQVVPDEENAIVEAEAALRNPAATVTGTDVRRIESVNGTGNPDAAAVTAPIESVNGTGNPDAAPAPAPIESVNGTGTPDAAAPAPIESVNGTGNPDAAPAPAPIESVNGTGSPDSAS